MKGRWFYKILILVLAVGCLDFFWVEDAFAIPHFARNFNKRCSVCHAAVPKLNALGERFRLNGYQFPGTIDDTPLWYQDTPPLSGMFHGMYMNMTMENNTSMPMNGILPGDELTISEFQGQAFELFAGGTLGSHLSYFAFLEFEQGGALEDGNWVTERDFAFKQLFGMYNNVLGGNTGSMNLKFGLFEMEIPFSALRALGAHHATPYLVYSVDPLSGGHHGGTGFRFDSPQTGIAMSGILSSGFQYELGLVNGTNASFDTNDKQDVYLRLAQHIGDQRIGAFYYKGKSNLGSTVAQSNTDFFRVGLDFSFNFLLGDRHLNIFGQYMRGENDNIAFLDVGHDDGADDHDADADADHDADVDADADHDADVDADHDADVDTDHDADTDADHVADAEGDHAPGQKFSYDGYFIEADLSIIPNKLVTMYRYERLNVDKQAGFFTEDTITRQIFQVRWYFTPNFFTIAQYHIQDSKLGNMTMGDQSSFGVMNSDTKMFMFMLAYVL